MEKGCPKCHGACTLGGHAVWLWSVVSRLQLAAPPLNLLSCSLGPTRQCYVERTGRGPTGWLWPVGPAWQQALPTLPSPPPFLSPCRSLSLISILTSHSAGPSAPVSHSWESAVTRDSKLRTPGMAEVRTTGNRTGRVMYKSIWRNKELQFQKWVYNEKWSRVHRWIF